MNLILCEGRVLLVDKAAYIALPGPIEKDYEYVIALHDAGAEVSFHEELSPTSYVTHVETFSFKSKLPMTAHLQTSFLSFFEEAYWLDKVDIRKAVRFAVQETESYFTS